MEMEVMMPSAPVDFNFDSTCTSPYISAPSSPQRFGTFFFSAPTSPTRASSFYADFNNFSLHHDDHETSHDHESLSAVPFNWEEKPGMPKAQESLLIRDVNSNNYADKEFAFDFSGQLESSSLSADELFDGGKIKPLKPPPRLQSAVADSLSPKSPRSPKKKIKEALSPRHKMKDFDPFAAALEQTRKQNIAPAPELPLPKNVLEEMMIKFNAAEKGLRSRPPLGKKEPDLCPLLGSRTCYSIIERTINRMQRTIQLLLSLLLFRGFGIESGSSRTCCCLEVHQRGEL
ncbi:uncharacterized protein [Coffea arabica]|uniref:Uncharacterized protein n=1 Tax=Coffea arabica TaxID=13443 RepID=A0A6P6WAF9_COFAR